MLWEWPTLKLALDTKRVPEGPSIVQGSPAGQRVKLIEVDPALSSRPLELCKETGKLAFQVDLQIDIMTEQLYNFDNFMVTVYVNFYIYLIYFLWPSTPYSLLEVRREKFCY